MTTITQTIYSFSELSKQAQKAAIDHYRDIETDRDWWDFIYDEAKEIGLEITEFDTYHGSISGKLTESVKDSTEAILAAHGETCDTYKTASEFRTKWQVIEVLRKLLGTTEADEEAEEKFEQLADDYKKAILKNYMSILRDEYDYIQSDEAVREAIVANDYEFYEDGEPYHTRKVRKIA